MGRYRTGVTNKICRRCEKDLSLVQNATYYCSECKVICRRESMRRFIIRARIGNPHYIKYKKEYSKQHREKSKKIGIYIAYDSSGKILYVGRTDNFKTRMSAHKNVQKSEWLTKAVKVDFIQHPTYGDALVAEAILIRDHQPKYNKDGVTR